MTETIVKIALVLLVVSLKGNGRDFTTAIATTTSTSPPPIIISTANTIFDNVGSDSSTSTATAAASAAVLDLPLCSGVNFNFNNDRDAAAAGGGGFYNRSNNSSDDGEKVEGGTTSSSYQRIDSDIPKSDISDGDDIISETSGNDGDGAGTGHSGILDNFVEFFPQNESELIYGTDMEAIMMPRSGGIIAGLDMKRTSYHHHHHHHHRNKRSGSGAGGGGSGESKRRNSSSSSNSLTIKDVKYFTYGILWPTICGLGIIGNVLNLIVLNQPNMKGTAYIYMRGYSSAALMAITVAIPFANRILRNNEVGPWTNVYQAFFHTHVELYLGNSCLGIGVMMLVALTMERFVAVCHPEKSRALQGSNKAYIIIASIPICTFLTYSPHLFLSTLLRCVTDQGVTIYQKRSNQQFIQSAFFPIYKWFLGLVFRLIPTVLLAYLNLRIIIAYRRTCARRRIMTGKTSRDEKKKFAEESRIMLLLGSTSILFFVCVTPMVILSVMISDKLLKSFSFQVFRATANLLEVTNYSLTFYIYCLFSREFRNTFLTLLQFGKKKKGPQNAGPNGRCTTPTNKPSGGGSGTTGRISSDPAAIIQQKSSRSGSAGSSTGTTKGGGSGSAPLLAAVVCFLVFL